ncbi:Rpn family recombination-promoting nuclease/putative transposase [Alicyclobacillus tolerans]|uniref:Rpn family recombination-promoting nuclease/putative transposase n=1 Tax=Alicyclobacillus tolerans TaxID=90970 RepID=UPI001F4356BB|nr:Rpn family recombination-promoting nuclease/putative transposase [Alicyclobacillus tolerans]MCF8567046.1 Rpn family recombination-promoting nuclease/putative transposase [Alicyclobacillus tolerans]
MKKLPIRKAFTTREFLLLDEETQRLHEERQRALHDYVSDIEGAREEGREKGREEGTRAAAYKMLSAGMDVKQIAEFVDLPVEEVEKIRQQLS